LKERELKPQTRDVQKPDNRLIFGFKEPEPMSKEKPGVWVSVAFLKA
jgi:hypothetical protein